MGDGDREFMLRRETLASLCELLTRFESGRGRSGKVLTEKERSLVLRARRGYALFKLGKAYGILANTPKARDAGTDSWRKASRRASIYEREYGNDGAEVVADLVLRLGDAKEGEV